MVVSLNASHARVTGTVLFKSVAGIIGNSNSTFIRGDWPLTTWPVCNQI